VAQKRTDRTPVPQGGKELLLFEEFRASGADKAALVGQHIDIFNRLKVPGML
jgi:mannan endo-1,4-beta-mannosidase